MPTKRTKVRCGICGYPGSNELHVCTKVLRGRIAKAYELILEHGELEEPEYKQWIMDRALRSLLGIAYDEVIRDWEYNAKRKLRKRWDKGINPKYELISKVTLGDK